MSLSRLAVAGLAACIILSGCADKPVKRSPAARSAQASPARPAPSAEHEPAVAAGNTMEANPALPANTGIAACEDYLASYRACHRAAGIYAPDQIESHYQQMRQSLLRDSLKPEIRPQLAARCNSLAGTLRQALHGKACTPVPADADSTP